MLNDTETRAIHLAFAVFLSFLAYPAFRRSPRRHVPVPDWVFAFVGAFCAAYLFLFYRELAERPGKPTDMDIAAAAGKVLDPTGERFDLVIVGCGPAGLSAGVYGASEGLRTLVIDSGSIGGQHNRTTSFLVDQDVLIDAGTGVGDLSLPDEASDREACEGCLPRAAFARKRNNKSHLLLYG